jgi:plastocyanin domain-containing protein
MDAQLVINIAIGLVGFLGAWVLKSITDTLQEMKESDHALRNKVQAIELLVVGGYVKRSDFEKLGEDISKRFDKFEERILAHRP